MFSVVKKTFLICIILVITNFESFGQQMDTTWNDLTVAQKERIQQAGSDCERAVIKSSDKLSNLFRGYRGSSMGQYCSSKL